MRVPYLDNMVFRRVTAAGTTLATLGLVFLAYLIMAASVGCGSLGPAGGGLFGSAFLSASSRPADCADSVLWDLTGNPSLAGAPLVIAVYEVAKHKPQYRPMLIEAVTYAQGLFEQKDLTYWDFAAAITQRVEWLNQYLGGEILIITDLVGAFDQRVPITECDRRLICQHLAKQRKYLATLN